MKAQDLGWEYSNTPGTFSGDVQLQGQNFALKGQVLSSGGQLNLSGDGAIGDLNSSLQGLGFAASEDGYRIQARLNALQLRDLRLAQVKIPPYLEGTLSGQAVLTSGVSNFNLRAEPLTLAGESLVSRLSGTTQNGNWRLSGLLGNSSLSGQIDNGLLQLRLDAVGAPIHALLASYSGPLPAKATYTGLIQYKGPLNRWSQGQLDAIAERMVISGRGQRLSGTGVLQYRQGTFTISDTEFHGAGDWIASGVYTQDKVSLSASTRNAKFTPILLLIPQLQPLKPALEGNLDVQVSGSIEDPLIEVKGNQLSGQMSGLDFKLSRMNARYDQKQWQFDAPISSSGSIALDGQVHAQGYFTPENSLQNSFVTIKGKGNIENFGTLSSISAEIRQTGARWLLVSRAQQGGTLDLDGELYPQMLLRFSAKNLNPVIPMLYVKSSQLSATGQLEARGSEYWLSGLASFPALNIGSMPKSKTSPKVTPDPEASFISPLPDRLSTFEGRPNVSGKGNSFLQHLHFDQVLINARNGIKFDESIARAELGGFLTLNGTAADPQVSGLIRPLSGSVFLRENEFVIDTKRSTINFDPANGAFPTLAIFASGQVRTNTETLKVTIEVRSTVQTLNNGKPTLNIETRLSSVPPRDETTLYGLVALGELQADALTQSALRTALNVLILGEVERSVAKALGVDVVKVNSNWLDGGTNLTADFTIGQYITKNVYVQYNIDLSGHSLIDARYITSDGKFNFSVSTPIKGLDFNDLHPSFSLGYNFSDESSVSFGVESGTANVFKLGYELRW